MKLINNIKSILFLKFSNKIIGSEINPKYYSIQTHMTKEELIKIYELASKFKSNSKLVEIGSYLGASSCFLGTAAIKNNSKVYCIDTWENDAMSEGKRDTFTEFCKNIESVKDSIIIKRGRSSKIAIEFNRKVDLIFFDGDHSYKGIKSDVDVWIPKVKSGGLVVFHDSGWAKGVIKVIEKDIKPLINKSDQLSNLWWGWLK